MNMFSKNNDHSHPSGSPETAAPETKWLEYRTVPVCRRCGVSLFYFAHHPACSARDEKLPPVPAPASQTPAQPAEELLQRALDTRDAPDPETVTVALQRIADLRSDLQRLQAAHERLKAENEAELSGRDTIRKQFGARDDESFFAFVQRLRTERGEWEHAGWSALRQLVAAGADQQKLQAQLDQLRQQLDTEKREANRHTTPVHGFEAGWVARSMQLDRQQSPMTLEVARDNYLRLLVEESAGPFDFTGIDAQIRKAIAFAVSECGHAPETAEEVWEAYDYQQRQPQEEE